MNITTEKLERAGRLLYGDQWQSNLARDLNIDSRRVRQWTTSDRPISEWVYSELLIILRNNAQSINQFIETLESDMGIIEQIKTAKSINELCELLNEYERDFDRELGKPSDLLDYSDLPVFSDNNPDSTEGIFSYSDSEILVQNNVWSVQSR